MPALGYIPSGQFAFPRSYIPGIEVRHDLIAPVWTDHQVVFWIAGPPDALCIVDFDPRFLPWSSNRWTLDHLVTSAVYGYPPNPAVFDLPYYLVYRIPPGRNRGCVLLDVTYGGTYTVHDLDPQPSGYWLPPEMP